MSGTGKGVTGLWLYKMGDRADWTMKESMKRGSLQAATVEAEADDGSKNATYHNCVVFSLNSQVDGLARALKVFEDNGVNVVHIESRKSKRRPSEYEILVDVDCENRLMNEIKKSLAQEVASIDLASYEEDEQFPHPFSALSSASTFDSGGIPWFPRHIAELDHSQRVFMYGTELEADHPSFKDPVYRKRHKYFADLAMQYKYGQPIPRIDYTQEEISTWGTVFRELHSIYPLYACKEYLENWPLLVEFCGFREDNIPQLEDLNVFLKRKTGFTLRPVAGYLSPRDFLAGLAFRVFHCTQFIRHSSDPFYTPEPDCCHELLGHMPLLASPSFAQFSQEIGLASLGASEDDVQKIATCYFFCVEFGLCKEGDELRAYGAGLLSSVSELKHAIEAKEKIRMFDPETTCTEECIITSYQNYYFCTDSFEDAMEKMRAFLSTIKRPFGVRFNPYTQSVDIMSNVQKIGPLLSELRGDLCIVRNGLKKIPDQDETVDIDRIAHMVQEGIQIEDSEVDI